jgi:hypothetical protein
VKLGGPLVSVITTGGKEAVAQSVLEPSEIQGVGEAPDTAGKVVTSQSVQTSLSYGPGPRTLALATGQALKVPWFTRLLPP